MTSTTDCPLVGSPSEESRHSLSFEQVQRLTTVLATRVKILPKEGNFPALSISPSRLVKVVRKRLEERGISVKDVRLNGSGASFCLVEERDLPPQPRYNDLDVIFGVELRDDFDLHIIKDQVLNSLFDFFPDGAQTDRISCYMLEESYVKKMVKVSTGTDRWSLIALGDESGMNIELKFVHNMRRQYEFSVDSFQIILDPVLCFDDALDGDKPVQVGPSFFPRAYAISIYGSFSDALNHLNKRLISTKNPEQIRGGGLLKYCCLQVCGYQPADPEAMGSLEPYMCSRFFIDFPLANLQYAKINKYLYTRFLQQRNGSQGLEFLDTLLRVVSRCCMESERQKTMGIVMQIRANLSWLAPRTACFPLPIFYRMLPSPVTVHGQWHHHPHQNHQHPGIPPRYHFYQYNNPSSRCNHRHNGYNYGSNRKDRRNSTPPRFLFPHSVNNTLPVGPVPTPVR